MGVAPCSSVTGFVRAPLSRCAERVFVGSFEGVLSSRARVFTRARAQPRLGRSLHIAWGDVPATPVPTTDVCNPQDFFFNDVCSSQGSLRIAPLPTRLGNAGFTPALASGFRLAVRRHFFRSPVMRRPSDVLVKPSRLRACVTSTRPRWRERPSSDSLCRVNGQNDAGLLRTPSTFFASRAGRRISRGESRALGDWESQCRASHERRRKLLQPVNQPSSTPSECSRSSPLVSRTLAEALDTTRSHLRSPEKLAIRARVRVERPLEVIRLFSEENRAGPSLLRLRSGTVVIDA